MNDINKYVVPIIKKKHKHDFLAWLSLRKVLKGVSKLEISYNTILEIYQFIQISESVYLNLDKNNCNYFSAADAKNNVIVNMRIYKEECPYITFKLGSDDSITIDLLYTKTNGESSRRVIEFKSGKMVSKNTYEEEFNKVVTNAVRTKLKKLIIRQYKLKEI